MTLQLIIVLFFIAILLALIAVYMSYAAVKESPSYELKKRLRRLAMKGGDRLSEDLKVEILHEMTSIDRYLFRFSPVARLDKFIESAGLKVDVKIFALIMLVCGAAAAAAGIALRREVILPILLFFLGALLPLFVLSARKKKRMIKFTEQFPNALDMISRSLKVGHAFSSAILMISTEMGEPVAGLFKQAYEEQTLGLSLRDALTQMMERMPSGDLQLFVTTVNVHKEVGGNIAETLDRLAATIRERLKIRRQVRVHSAQARLSGYILAVIPLFMALFFYVTTPGYIEGLVQTSTGRYAIGYAVVSQLIGFLVIRKIINIRI